ncbi:MAG: hypothetical protein VXZ78_03270, partial [Pseudomonadota bacterium]|nr:hypothetical protein [Pseudomonadota bacterium]
GTGVVRHCGARGMKRVRVEFADLVVDDDDISLLEAAKEMDDNGKKILEATEENERGWVDLTNQIGNMTLFPKSNNYYMGDNIPGKPRQTVFFMGGFPMYREQCEAAFDGLNAFEVV